MPTLTELQSAVAQRIFTETRISALQRAEKYADYQRVIGTICHELGRSGEDSPLSTVPHWQTRNGTLTIFDADRHPVCAVQLRTFVEHHVPFASEAERLGFTQATLFE